MHWVHLLRYLYEIVSTIFCRGQPEEPQWRASHTLLTGLKLFEIRQALATSGSSAAFKYALSARFNVFSSFSSESVRIIHSIKKWLYTHE